MKRRHISDIPLQDRLLAFIDAMRARAALVPPGSERDELLNKAKKAEVELWANSSELQPPK
ncbi:hypothetical protein [Nitrobacter hamburgensis]|uniref:hypothetical protein n=1 Tax=Nitrobacter hamburgensis TaxID=912 RepID=UPI0003199BA4|nr:hypothetical protein [Nitrobacter hamburgensis]